MVEFDDFSDADYDYQSATLQFATQLRQLSYSITAGYNVTNPDIGPDDGSPRWEVSAEYDSGANRIQLLTEAFQTDTSRGNQNSLLALGQPQLALGNGTTVVADTFDRKAHTISWTNTSLCTRCTATLTGSYSTESYNQQTDLNNDQLLASVEVSYQLSRLSRVRAGYRFQETDFDTNNILPSFDSDTIELSYNRQITDSFDLRISASQTERNGELIADGFDETSVSVTANYQFN